jgi:uncharacterized repeat protein (TIGR01451 family)
MWFKRSAAGFCLCALSVMTSAFAQSGPVQSKLTANQVVEVAGKPVLKPAAQAHPGDVVEYRAVYTNNGATGIGHLLATIPVPAGTTYIAGSAVPAAGAQASLDGVHFAPMPLMHVVNNADGKPDQKPVPLADYRALRWQVPALSAHADVTASLRVRINPPVSAK